MKLVDDDGKVVGEYDDTDGFLIFTKEGLAVVMPDSRDEKDVPQHLMMCVATMIYVSEKEGRDEIQAFFESKISQPH